MPVVMKQTEFSEQVVEIEIERLRPFKGHPFKVREDNDMKALKDSIRQYGIMSPLIVRPLPDGCYEIISGHRRKYAASRLGYRKVPVIIRVMKDDDSIISMVDSNLQRDKISFSEKAFAYKMKNDAMKRMHLGTYIEQDGTERRIRTIQAISSQFGDSPRQIQRYINLTRLLPEILKKLDDGEIGFSPAVALSSLKKNEQEEFMKAMEYAKCAPSYSQGLQIKQLSKDGELTLEKMEDILSEVKKHTDTCVSFTNQQLHAFFPKDFTVEMMKREIIGMLKDRLIVEERLARMKKGGEENHE